LVALANRAQQGDESAMVPLRKLMQDPAYVEALGGNLAHRTQVALIDKYSGKNLMVKESIGRKLDLMRAELAGLNPSPLERLLADRIVACWLHLHHLEAIYVGKDSMELGLATFYQRSISAAQKRYLAAIKTLAIVRKMAVPVLQVNIAKKQVNVAGAIPTSPEKGNTE
jgi:hypothetical protein